MAGDRRAEFWHHLRMLDLSRRLRADLEGLADARPDLEGAVLGVGVFLADQVADDPEASVILRGERRRAPLTQRIEAAQRQRAS